MPPTSHPRRRKVMRAIGTVVLAIALAADDEAGAQTSVSYGPAFDLAAASWRWGPVPESEYRGSA
jgi:hypothetical protein